MTELSSKKCVPCEGGVDPITGEALDSIMQQVPKWQLNEERTKISRAFTFENYYQTTAFVNAAIWVAHQEDHHADISFGYNQCHIEYWTHAIDGLSENDFICAAKIDRLLS